MPTCKLPGKVVQNTHNLLRDLGEPFPTNCQQPNSNIRFPDSALSAASTNHNKCHWTSLVVYKCLQEAGLIFTEYELPEGEGGVMWSRQKLDEYLNLQDRLVDDYQCLNTTQASGVLSPYFHNITAVVNQQDGSACGWEILRSDLLRVLRLALHKHHSCFNWTRVH
ncbi:interferon alpha-G-like [Anableps anableps]